MTTVELKNDFNETPQVFSDKQKIEDKKNLILTIILTMVIIIVLGIQIVPYFYGGVIAHSHGGGCAWPYNCKGIKNF